MGNDWTEEVDRLCEDLRKMGKELDGSHDVEMDTEYTVVVVPYVRHLDEYLDHGSPTAGSVWNDANPVQH